MDVLMPQLGETVAEGKITKWFKSAGDAVKPGDNLFEIETDKVSMEVPSITAGVLSEIRVSEGEVAKVGAVVAIISGEGAAASAPPAGTTPAAPSPRGGEGRGEGVRALSFAGTPKPGFVRKTDTTPGGEG
jgi:pyruvate/2-oxoglutarate dehydrogenase complex dihydrolipoamide acyltransferase (E2) component